MSNKKMAITKSKDQFILTTDSQRMQLTQVHRYLAKESYWCPEIPENTVREAVDNSLCFGVFDTSISPEKQVGFARVVTDYATFAWICDVYVEKEWRGLGLSKWMMAEIVAHPGLKNLRRLCLATLGAHKLYEKFGFSVTQTPGAWMEIKDNEIYMRMKNGLNL